MSEINRRSIAVMTGLGLLGAGVIGAVLLVKTKPQAERMKPMSSMIPVVETMPLEVSSRPLVVEGLGTVIADKAVSIRPQVSGKIVSVSDALVEGGHVKKGDVLIEIEDADYRLALAKAEAALLTARSTLRLEEGEQSVARHEMELLDDAGDVDESYRDLMLREPQLLAVQANVASAQATLETAALNLERTTINAPFDAVVVAAEADAGDFAQSSMELVELAATDRYFIRASVPLSALVPLPNLGKQPYPATLTLSDGTTREARTHRLLPDLTRTGRMAQMLLVVDAPYTSQDGRPLLLDEMVRFRIQGTVADNVTLIPRSYLRDGDVVWMMDREKKLKILPAKVLQGYADDVLVRIDGADGMELVITDLVAAVDGMQLRLVGDSATGAKRAEPQNAEQETEHE